MSSHHAADTPEGIFSLLDTDFYKLTMQCAILKHFPDTRVSYKFTNRTPHMRFSYGAFTWLRRQINQLENVTVTDDEIAWLKKSCQYLSDSYFAFLGSFHLHPSKQVELAFTPTKPGDITDSTLGVVDIAVHGLWSETILYEIPVLALTSEAYFKFVDRDWNHDGQVVKAKHKGQRLLEAGCFFSEFGSRRRRDYKTHEMVIRGLIEAQKEADNNGQGWKGKLTGTSNVHFAMRFGLNPIGTVAHEWFMGIAAITQDYKNANEKAMQYWIDTFGPGELGIALTDTFGTPSFLRSFARPAPRDVRANVADWNDPTYAQIFKGVRQDSGDPLSFVQMMRTFYRCQNITDKKSIVFSDSLNVDRCIKYKKATDDAGLTPSFGIGTFFTNDFRQQRGEKSLPLNIVMKLSKANGWDAIKLSDDTGKNTGDDDLMRSVKEQVGYEDKVWADGDEAHRWDEDDG